MTISAKQVVANETKKVKKKVVATATIQAKTKEKEIIIAEVEEEVEGVIDMSRYVYMDNVKEILDIAYESNTNVILYGKGGK